MAWTNHFLESLDAADLRALRPHLEEIQLERDAILSEVGQLVGDVWLPIDCILSVVTVMRDGAQVESRTIGREGGYGLLHALGSRMAFERMLVQVGGRCWRMPVGPLQDAAARSAKLNRVLVQHAQASLLQASRAVACNTLHAAEQRLCRWLLLTQDRLQSEVVPLTQEHLSVMLGVQRTTVTALASQLQARGLIFYARGKIRVLDRERLERCACECYAFMQGGAERILASDG